MKTSIICSVALAALSIYGAGAAQARDGAGPITNSVPKAVTPIPGTARADVLASPFHLKILAQYADPVENPSGVITMFGKLSTGEGTEPDQNTYLEMPNPGGPTAGYDYGTHFLFQGHENGGNLAFVTRINLDVADPAHRITLLTPVDAQTGKTGFNSIDGSTYDPFTNSLLFGEETEDDSSNGAGNIHSVSVTWPPVHKTYEAFIGLGGWEGIHLDKNGVVYLIEDIGGAKAPSGTTATVDGVANVPLKSAKQPNSFVYRYLPNNPKDLSAGGRLQALQVFVDGAPLKFHADDVIGDITSPKQSVLYTPGNVLPFRWLTIHKSNAGDTAAFNATAAAKALGATPFKRPENMAFDPTSDFNTFYVTVTGDTDAPTGQVPQLAKRAAWGAIVRVEKIGAFPLASKGYDGVVSTAYLGDADHASFDNIAFGNTNQLLVAEDRGDTLHDQLAKFDSIWTFSVRGGVSSKRLVALGSDPIAAPAGAGDNEPTGVMTSNGSVLKSALLGTVNGLVDGRTFFTQQHGLNRVFEVIRR
ncbi:MULTISPECIES: alkaline phosphatase PhoX [Methylosinus]|uniref:DUF839 domain-containing protein n=1 Tax=Methylosinus trichosporium (strain ATCC 35070 / NCIMB 11131 / UNIQEM 75 / OB3b) TaxID=595536 RepID=A0A2D2CVA3_METT3|nr:MULTISPECIES: alkaline phosphatase PhoX [Methylosinus]ATQ66657.1 DUF839 domain-containing protein [Methylosinus trichosporium OB3b]OBS51738.1 hypothetical protein A8B73_15050 [Methylosinus sp. 3S-1]